ncbi:dipeptidase [Bordetella sp. H567]|uniref:dipeptidase n=1 Tax=Bordetella sp. H567 TaxID=1697043 RepID=UPI0009F5D57A|nr:membrane dipeptidase [Bordetella sp. H567]
MRLQWRVIYSGAQAIASGRRVVLAGYPVFPLPGRPSDTLALTEDMPCCGAHASLDADRAVEVHAGTAVPVCTGPVRVEGYWEPLRDDPAGWRYRIRGARVTPIMDPWEAAGLNRRRFLALGALSGLAACAAPSDPQGAAPHAARAAAPASDADTLAWMRAQVTVDIHSHAGHMTLGRAPVPRAFSPVASPMRAGGMDVVCLAIVTDSSVDHIVETASGRRRIVAYREPAPGEMAARGEASFQRLHALMSEQGLRPVLDGPALAAARATGGGVIVAAEGADFLEGDAGRLEDAWRRHALRHLQLTHYRVNELGDIQTAPPVHGGLTDFGAEVIRLCNRLGIVVDVAHGTQALVKRAAAVTTRPLVLSHTALSQRPSRYGRAISAEHARLIADTDGVIGVWPLAATYPSLAAMAGGIRAMVDVVGVRHVGVGTDMLGLLGPSALDSYRKLPQLARALLDAGFTQEEAGLILGGNYARVWAATMTS